jgi:hypothetical protein
MPSMLEALGPLPTHTCNTHTHHTTCKEFGVCILLSWLLASTFFFFPVEKYGMAILGSIWSNLLFLKSDNGLALSLTVENGKGLISTLQSTHSARFSKQSFPLQSWPGNLRAILFPGISCIGHWRGCWCLQHPFRIWRPVDKWLLGTGNISKCNPYS